MKRKPWADRGSRQSRGYGAEWQKLRLIILRRDNYLCQACQREGRVSPATSVDHVKAKAKGGTDDPSNLEGICDHHRALKDALDRGRPLRPRVAVDAEGWPLARPCCTR